MAEAAKEGDRRARLENHVDLGGREFQGRAFDLCNSLGESFDGDIVQERAGFNQTNAFGQGSPPFFTADRFGRRRDATDFCAPAVHNNFTGLKEFCRRIGVILIHGARLPLRLN